VSSTPKRHAYPLRYALFMIYFFKSKLKSISYTLHVVSDRGSDLGRGVLFRFVSLSASKLRQFPLARFRLVLVRPCRFTLPARATKPYVEILERIR